MASLKEVRTRISSVTSTQQITKAMKMVAAAKLRRAQDKIIQIRPYVQKLYEILQNVSSDKGDMVNVYSEERDVEKVLLVVISSDRGLCGAFNSNVIKKAVFAARTEYVATREDGNLVVLPIGKKALDFFKKNGFEVIEDFAGLLTDLSFENVRAAAEYVMKGYREEEFDTVVLVYNEFKNVATQVLQAEQFLPIPEKEEDHLETATHTTDYIFEPSKDYIVEELIPTVLKIQFFKALLESNAAEQGARMTAMDQATENAGELLKQLKLDFNRTRQASITKEILEIVGGAEALSK